MRTAGVEHAKVCTREGGEEVRQRRQREREENRQELETSRGEPPRAEDLGRQLTVYWEEDDEWYDGVLQEIDAGRDDGNETGGFRVIYEDGDDRWEALGTRMQFKWRGERLPRSSAAQPEHQLRGAQQSSSSAAAILGAGIQIGKLQTQLEQVTYVHGHGHGHPHLHHPNTSLFSPLTRQAASETDALRRELATAQQVRHPSPSPSPSESVHVRTCACTPMYMPAYAHVHGHETPPSSLLPP